MMEECNPVQDVEEGEISDSASVEEISEDAFKRQDPPTKIVTSNLTNNQNSTSRVWTMRDVYKYPISRDYARGLYNLAWAQAVQNKPLEELFVMTTDDSNSKQSETEKVIIDVEDDDANAKEEGELEEGEIDLDADVLDSKEANFIREQLQNVTLDETDKSFPVVCSKLQSSLDRLGELAVSVPGKDLLIQLFMTALQTVTSVFCSMNQSHKDENRDILSRLLIHAKSQIPALLSSEQLKKDEGAIVRMKPRDPRRALHNTAVLKGGNVGSDQCKTGIAGTQAMTSSLCVQRQEDQLDRKSIATLSTTPPDIARQFTKNLKNIADMISVSPSTLPSVASRAATQHIQVNQSRLEGKGTVSESSEQPNDAALASVKGSLQPQSSWGDVEHLFEGYSDQQRADIQTERARRLEEQKKMFAVRKLCLVLDLDHTLLNSAKFVEIDPVHEEILRKKEEQDREKPYRHIFRFPQMGMWTKLRPGVWNFLEKASNLFELHLYTMGNKLYATEMAKLLDPKGDLFAGRVISRGDDGDPFDGDERVPKSKDLEGVLGMESAVVIIDDSVRVWPHNKLNLIVVERYIYFPCSRRQFGLRGPSLLEIDHDERPEDGTLASCLGVIQRIHQNFFTHWSIDEADVRNILATEQQNILAGCRIVFSRVFPVGEANPHLHPLWQTAEQFGAVCTSQIDEQVTHVVANSLGTDKVNWALSTGRFVVHPGWVEASALLYRRANEHDFAIKP